MHVPVAFSLPLPEKAETQTMRNILSDVIAAHSQDHGMPDIAV
jgi:hypothetical protein